MTKIINVRKFFWWILFIILFASSCVPPTDEVITEVNIDFSNPELQKLYDFIDRQEIDSIILYTNHPDPAFRVLVAYGFSSIKPSAGLDSLITLLDDPITAVRSAASYAVGQTGQSNLSSRLLDAFKNRDTVEVNSSVNCSILEAVGKIGDSGLLRSLATVSTYRPSDTLLLLGQTRAIYRYGLRSITVPEGTDLMVQYVTDKNYPTEVRLMAAHYLQRTRGISIEEYKFQLTETFIEEQDPFIRMSLANALSKTNDVTVMASLIEQFNSEEDYRVKVNILRSLSSFPYIRVIETVLAALNDPNIHVANTAAQYLVDSGNSSDATIYKSFIQDTMDWSVKLKIYTAVLNNLPHYYTRTKAIYQRELTNIHTSLDDPYHKASVLNAMSYDPLNYRIIKDLGFEASSVEKTAAVQALGRILSDEDFNRIFNRGSNRVKLEIVEFLKEAIASGDEGMLSVSSNILANIDQALVALIDDTTFINEAIGKLVLPRDNYLKHNLLKASAHIKGEEAEELQLEYTHPIEWNICQNLSDSSVVNIKTSKGLIKAILFKKLTPGTVSNFVSLVQKDFYDGKIFHRVVPNFVIQTGSPRGDGYGSINYNIRSELPPLYYDDEGYLGMARSEPHTESSQWFVSHSPTPHLDGNYTIFGKVVSGMDIVHKIVVGDRIDDIIITSE